VTPPAVPLVRIRCEAAVVEEESGLCRFLSANAATIELTGSVRSRAFPYQFCPIWRAMNWSDKADFAPDRRYPVAARLTPIAGSHLRAFSIRTLGRRSRKDGASRPCCSSTLLHPYSAPGRHTRARILSAWRRALVFLAEEMDVMRRVRTPVADSWFVRWRVLPP
jgi:hypothetical protein